MRKAAVQAQDQGNRRRGRDRPRRHRRVVDCDRDRLLRPHARPAGAPFAHRHRRSQAKGDLHIDHHHTTEDVGIALGQAVKQALGDMKGITRYADVHMPMDEALTRVAIDISGRPFLVFKAQFGRDKVGTFDTELVQRMVPGLRDECRHHAACRDAVRHQRPPYRRVLLQGPGARAARRDRDRSARGRRDPVDQGHARG